MDEDWAQWVWETFVCTQSYIGKLTRTSPLAVTSVLDAPELRNQIYAHAISEAGGVYIVSHEHALETFKALVTDPARPCTPRRRLDRPSRTKDWSRFRRQYLGLTQVSRQIRSEFGPLYRERQWYYTQIEDINRFLDTFVYAGGVVAASPPRINLFPQTINLYRLIGLRHEAAANGGDVQIIFTTHEGDDKPVNAFNPLLHTTKPAWTEFLAQHLTRIEVAPAHGNHRMALHLHVRREYFETEKTIKKRYIDILGPPDGTTDYRPRNAARKRWERSLDIGLSSLRLVAIIWKDG